MMVVLAAAAAAVLLLTLAQRARADVGLPLPTMGVPVVVTTSDSATISVTVAQGAVAAQWTVQYGTTTGYGATTTPVTIPAGSATSTVTTTIAGLWADGTYHFRSILTTVAGALPGADATFATQTAATGIDDGDPQDTQASGLDLGVQTTPATTTPATVATAPVATPLGVTPTAAACRAAPPLNVQAAGCTPTLIAAREGGRSILALLLPPGTTGAALTLTKSSAKALAGARVTIRTRTRSLALRLTGSARTATKAGVRLRRTGSALTVSHLPSGTASMRITLRTAVSVARISAAITTASTTGDVR